jgi:hypothetical protein
MSATRAQLLVNLDEPAGIHRHFLDLRPKIYSQTAFCSVNRSSAASFLRRCVAAAAFTSTNAFSGQLLAQAGPSMRSLHRSHLVARYIAVLFFAPLDFAAA